TALNSSASPIAIRTITREGVADLHELLRQRIREAMAYRERVVRASAAYRVVLSGADFLRGLLVDRYNHLLPLHIRPHAMDQEGVRQAVIAELDSRLKAAAIAERVDPRVRDLEQLPARSSGLLQGEKSSTVFAMNGVRFHYEASEGQKTGAFLDQRENYAAAAEYGRGEALD